MRLQLEKLIIKVQVEEKKKLKKKRLKVTLNQRRSQGGSSILEGPGIGLGYLGGLANAIGDEDLDEIVDGDEGVINRRLPINQYNHQGQVSQNMSI